MSSKVSSDVYDKFSAVMSSFLFYRHNPFVVEGSIHRLFKLELIPAFLFTVSLLFSKISKLQPRILEISGSLFLSVFTFYVRSNGQEALGIYSSPFQEFHQTPCILEKLTSLYRQPSLLEIR